MEMQLLTPTEIWEGFNPVKENTETSIVSSRENDNIVTSELFFTSEKTRDGRVRVFARISYDMRWRDPRPAILILPSQDSSRRFDDISASLVKEGYVVCICDYCGNFGGDDENTHTAYPDEYSYAQAPKCFAGLYTLTTTGRDSAWFQWAKVARRAITMISEMRYVDAERIAVMGADNGAQIAWQVAGMDGRVRAAIPINGGGYLWCKDRSRFEGNTLPRNDEERAFSAGVGAETYAKFVSCPVCYIVSSNSVYTDVDRAGDILALVPAKAKNLMIVRGSAAQISLSVYESLMVWLRKNFAHDSAPTPMPSVRFEADENSLYLHAVSPASPDKLSVFVSRGEPVSFARTWAPLSEGQQVGDHELTFRIPVENPDEIVVAYASAVSDDGVLSCSPVSAFLPSEAGISAVTGASTGSSRIIYSGDMGKGLFWVTTDDFFLDDSLPSVTTGPFGIKGISTSKGKLVLCRTTHDDFSSGKNAILQMDIYSPEKKTVCFGFISYPDMTLYRGYVALQGGDFWQKIKLSASDMKSEEGRPLPRFGICKQMTIADAENVVFNNIIWI